MVGDSIIATILHDMATSDAVARFPHNRSRPSASISRIMRYTFGLLTSTASRRYWRRPTSMRRYGLLFHATSKSWLLKAFVARWSPNTNTTISYYGELDNSLWDVHHITRLPIIGEMYDEFIPFKNSFYSAAP